MIWRRSGPKVGNILNEKGPVFIAIKVIPEFENEPIGRRQRRPTRNRAETIRDLQDGTRDHYNIQSKRGGPGVADPNATAYSGALPQSSRRR
jgi:hypothetical protein